MQSSAICEESNDISERRDAMLRWTSSLTLIKVQSGNSIHTGIFRRFPARSMTETAPSPRSGLRRI
jgi:hypothetical protein